MLFWLAIFGIGVVVLGSINVAANKRQNLRDEQNRIERRLKEKAREKELGIESKPRPRRRRR